MNFLLPLTLLLLAQPEIPGTLPSQPETSTKRRPNVRSAKRKTSTPPPSALPAPLETSTETPDTQPSEFEASTRHLNAYLFQEFLLLPPPATEHPEGPVGYLIESPKPQKTKKPLPRLGVRLDVGLPDGAGLDFLGRPVPFLQLYLGMMSNALGVGLRGGASYSPKHGVFRPALSLEAGHHFNGATWYLPSNTDLDVRNFVSSIQYTFVNGTLGFDLGSPNVAFVFRFGGSFLFFSSQGISPQKMDDATRFYMKKAKFRTFLPTFKFGISVCFL